MKKLFALALMICLVCAIALSATAESKKDVSITFRGINWGIPVTQIDSKMPEGVRLYAPEVSDGFRSVEYFLYDGNDDYYKGAVGYSVQARSSSLENMKVAGYEVSSMYMYFACVPGSDGLPTGNQEDSAFYAAYYKLEPKDADAAYDDLVTKLTGLYGDVFATYEKSPYISYKYTVWKGADGSMVSLEKEDYPSGSHYIYIKYAAGNGEELLKNAYQALVLQESHDAASNTDGL